MGLHLPELSDEFENIYAVVEKPKGWRAAWAVLRGKYEPEVKLNSRLTAAGYNKILKDNYLPGIRDAMNQPSPFLEGLDDRPPTE